MKRLVSEHKLWPTRTHCKRGKHIDPTNSTNFAVGAVWISLQMEIKSTNEQLKHIMWPCFLATGSMQIDFEVKIINFWNT